MALSWNILRRMQSPQSTQAGLSSTGMMPACGIGCEDDRQAELELQLFLQDLILS